MTGHLTKREQQIIDLLGNHPEGLSGESIAQHLGSTERSIRVSIHDLRRLGHNIVMMRRPDLRGPKGGMAGVYQLMQVSA